MGCRINVSLCLILFINNVYSSPFKQESSENYDRRRRDADRIYDPNVAKYLINFGYLPKSGIETGNLRTIESLQDAIKNLQKFANLPQTGKVDEETLKLLKKPRCGAPDNVQSSDLTNNRRYKRYVIQGQKWDHTDLTWSLVNKSMSTIDVGQVRRVLHEALGVWEANSKLTFREVNSNNADIQVLFAQRFHGDGYHFDGRGGVLAHAFYPGTGFGGDAHFDEEENWTLFEDDEKTSLFDVALHEFGHSLGLGHSSNKEAIMFPWNHLSFRGKDKIPEDDRLAIQQIYGAKHKQYGHNPYRPPVTTTTTSTTTTTPPSRRTYYDVNHFPNKNDRDHPRSRYNTRVSTTERTRTRYHYNVEQTTKNYYRYKHTTESPRDNEYPRHPDYEKPRIYYPASTTKPNSDKPKKCVTSYDAITIIRNELYIFKDQYMWRFIHDDSQPREPILIASFWRGVPKNLTHIDSVYETKSGRIVFFIGKYYYTSESNEFRDQPRPLTDLGIPSTIEKIDAALIWSHNNQTYLYSGTLYWRFDEETKRVEADYPRDMSMWKGIGYEISSAMQYRDGKTYFFKGDMYWEFNDYRMQVAHESRRNVDRWMKCHHHHRHIQDKEPLIELPPTSTAYRLKDTSWNIFVLLLASLGAFSLNIKIQL